RRGENDTKDQAAVKLRLPAALGLLVIAALSLLVIAAIAGCGGDSSTATSGASEPRVIFHGSGGVDAILMVEVARTPREKATGLMNHRQLDLDRGMIFVWDQPVQGGFWMKDTYIPLSIAFIAANGTVIDIEDMQPLSVQQHTPSGPYVYAVEANQGWFASHGLKKGDSAAFLE
ncbi:MAG: DUF192 domain-containing protein, partial [Actinomycetota bacterium]